MLQTHTWSIGLAAHPGGSVAADRELRSPRRRRHCCCPRGVEAEQKWRLTALKTKEAKGPVKQKLQSLVKGLHAGEEQGLPAPPVCHLGLESQEVEAQEVLWQRIFNGPSHLGGMVSSLRWGPTHLGLRKCIQTLWLTFLWLSFWIYFQTSRKNCQELHKELIDIFAPESPLFVFASFANDHSVCVRVYVVHNFSGPFEQLAVSSLFANISVSE